MAQQFEEREMPEARIVVVAPANQSTQWLAFWHRSENSHRNLRIYKDSEAWNRLGARPHDMYLYDRCGRLAFHIQHPESDVVTSHYVTSSLYNVYHNQPCGTCEYDRQNYARERPTVSVPLPDTVRDTMESSRAQQTQYTRPREETTTSKPYERPPPPVAPATQYYQKQEPSNEPVYTGLPEDTKWAGASVTPSSTRMQIPPTHRPGTVRTTTSGYRDRSSLPTPRPLFIHGEDCNLYTDARCLKQQKRVGPERLEPCCYKGLYLTDVCMPGRCTQSTYHLCCLQKFIQARYLCCHNETLPGESDDFNRCCYQNLVWLDFDSECCPAHIASQFWAEKSSLFEMCLPNVDIDFTGVVVTSALKDGTNTSLRMSEHANLWKYKCPYLEKFPDNHYYYQPDRTAAEVFDVIQDLQDYAKDYTL